ncbi:MAG: protein GlmU [Desulfobacterales bacterium]|nr:protein GlmU [Desulfobacterales bacterium]
MPVPDSVELGPEMDPERISGDGVTIHAGCRIFGKDTYIGPGAELGLEAPATIDNCQVGRNVHLKGGFFSQAVFLEGASCGSCAHVRSGTILEEGARIAHSVGLKQTILFPYVTLGSLINFCDCLMAGGTDKKNHSEVGSSYIHFNYTPQQDKATASLMGDVPGGVMLDRPPIFLGGQGGLVGPCRLGYGVTIAAGTINRKDELRSNRLIFGGGQKGGNMAYTPGVYRNVKRILTNNLIYIGNLMALGKWYRDVRSQFISGVYPQPLHDGLSARLNQALDERIKRLGAFFENLSESGGTNDKSVLTRQKKALYERRSEIHDILEHHRFLEDSDSSEANFSRERLLEAVRRGIAEFGSDYLRVLKSLSTHDKAEGTKWLQTTVDDLASAVMPIIPEFTREKGK